MDNASGGAIIWNLDIDAKKFNAGIAQARNDINSLGSTTQKSGNSISGMFTAIGKSSVIAAAGVGALAAVFSPFINNAVKRVDIMNAFPKVMANMGIAADQSSAAMKRIDNGIRGLPTALDTATLAVQRLTTKTGNVDKSTDIFLALNNAIIAGAAPMELQTNALEQFSQSFAKGTPDMMEWRSLISAMPAQLDQVSKSMGLANADMLGEKLRDGSVSMQDFSEQLIKLNSNGINGLPSLAIQAKNASDGLQTAMANAKTAITRGIASIMTAIGTSKIGSAITSIGSGLEKMFKFIAANIDVVAVFIGTILATAFATLAVAVVSATWPALALAAGVTLLYLAYQKLKPYIDIAIQKFNEFWQLIKPLRDFVAGQFVLAWQDLKNAFNQMMVALQPYMPVIKEVMKWTLIIAAVIVGTFIAAIVLLVMAIARLVGWIAQAGAWIENLKSSFISGLGNIKNIVVNALNGAGEWLINAGRAIIQGLIDGINNKVNAVKDALKSITDKLPDWKGPMTVDRNILKNSGVAVMQGFVTGLRSQSGLVESTLNGLTNSLATSAPGVSLRSEINDAPIQPITNHIGTINIAREVDADRVIARLTQDQEWQAKGLTT